MYIAPINNLGKSEGGICMKESDKKNEYTGALKAPVRCFGNHLSGKGKSSFQTDNECSGAAILKK